jgi:excisionase family DNA binding protein
MRIKSAYTTGEAAHICNLSQTTIIRLFDSGVLKGYRVPGSRFRRIPHEDLERFLTEHALPNTLAQPTANEQPIGTASPVDPATGAKPHPR